MKQFNLILPFAFSLVLGCSSDANNGATPDAGGDTSSNDTSMNDGSRTDTPGSDAGGDATSMPDSDSDAGGDAGDNTGELPARFTNQGLAYIGHLESTIVSRIRTDGTAATVDNTFDIGEPVIEMHIDRKRNLLVTAMPFASEVRIYQLPDVSDAAIPAIPTLLTTLTFTQPVLGVRFDPFNERLYTMMTLPLPAMGPQTESELYIYDTSDPANVTQMGAATRVPATISWDVDPVRRVMFLANTRDSLLYGFDVAEDVLTPLDGEPINLRTWFPQENQNGFAMRNITVDPWTNTIHAARSQGANSELITVTYPADIPNNGARYGQFASMTDLNPLADSFDADVEPGQRDNLIDAFRPVVASDDLVFMSVSAWNGTGVASGVVAFVERMHQTNCAEMDETSSFGCWFFPTSGGQTTQSYGVTDVGACVDKTNKVFLGTTYDANAIDSPGSAYAFKYTDDGTLTRMDTQPSATLGAYPVTAVCH